MPYFDYPDNVYINPYYLDVTPDVRVEMNTRAALYGTKTRSVGVSYNMYDSIDTKNIEWPYQKLPWARVTSLFKKSSDPKSSPLQLGLSYDNEMSDESGNLTLYSQTRNAPSKPLLTSVEISNEGQRGSLLKGKFAFTYFPELTPMGLDLQDLQESFFTPGRRVHIAFGWSTYARIPRVNKLEFAGVIFGFNWSFNPNMSISAEVQIVSPSSLAIGFSGDQTFDDPSEGEDNAVGELHKATNLLTVIEKDLRAQKGEVELDSGTICSWLPKDKTTTKTFDYVLVKLPITGYSSYLESSAANLQEIEWTERAPDIVVTPTGSIEPEVGGSGGGLTSEPKKERPEFTNDVALMESDPKFLEKVKSWVDELSTKAKSDDLEEQPLSTPDILGGNSPDYITHWYHWYSDSDWKKDAPDFSHSNELIKFRDSMFEKILNPNNPPTDDFLTWIVDDEGFTKQAQKGNIKIDWGKWATDIYDKNGSKKGYTVRYIGGIKLVRIAALLALADSINEKRAVLDDLVNIKRLEELSWFYWHRITTGIMYKNPKEGRTRYWYPGNWVGAGFDKDNIFSINRGNNIEGPLELLQDFNGNKNKEKETVGYWIDSLRRKILPTLYAPEKGLDKTEGVWKESITGELGPDARKLYSDYQRQWKDFLKWVGTSRDFTGGLNMGRYGPNGEELPQWKYYTNMKKTVGGIDMQTIYDSMPKAIVLDPPVGGIDKDRTKQVDWINQIIERIKAILGGKLENGEVNKYYAMDYVTAVVNGNDREGKPFFGNRSQELQKKLNSSPQSAPGGGSTNTDPIIIPGEKIVENRTYWFITLGDLVNFTNNLIEKYAENSNKPKYTFPLFNMVAFGNETDYNKELKSAYPVDVYFPDKNMGNYGQFQPFSVEPFSDLLRTFYISEKKQDKTSNEKKARIATDVINIGQILIGIDYIRKTYRNFLHDNATNLSYKNITSFFEDIIKRVNLASGDIYQLSVLLFEEPERLTNKETSPKDPLIVGDGGTNRRALLSIEDSNLSKKHTQMNEDDDGLELNATGSYTVRPYRFDANIMRPLIRNVNLSSRPSKEATFAAYIAARGEEANLNSDNRDAKAPPMSVDVDLSKPEYKDLTEYTKQYIANYKEKLKLENSAKDDGFNERWSDTYRGVLTKMKRLTYKPNMPKDDNAASGDPNAGSTDQTGAHWLNMAIYPIDLTLTIDGINGFKFGDVIRTTMIPAHYNTRWKVVFTVTKIIHKVTPSTWETTLHTAARLPLDEPNTGISDVGPVQPATAYQSQDQMSKVK